MSDYLFYIVLFLISLTLSLLAGKPVIDLLKKSSIKQFIREEGPQEHKIKKSSTPTLGGLIFLIPSFFITAIACFLKKEFLTIDLAIVLFVTFIMALAGFVDDFLKIQKKQNKGISGWTKLFLQFLLSLLIFYMYKENGNIIYLVWIFFIFSGACNAYNLTDGLDGLVASVSVLSLVGLSFLLYGLNKPELLVFCIILSGTLIGFLYYNKHPAKVFMGDTGSLAIGAGIGTIALVTHSELYLILFSAIPVLEALSVIIQVSVFKITRWLFKKPKRVFKMTPLHHHFELGGWKETTIVKRFFIFQAICVVIGIIFLKY